MKQYDKSYDVCLQICPCEQCDCEEEECILAKAYISQKELNELSNNATIESLKALSRMFEEAPTGAIAKAIHALGMQENDGWIPIDIGEPPLEYTDVFATLDDGSAYHLFYAKEKFRFGGYGGKPISGNVIAWEPFYTPEPYKEQQ